MAPLHALHVEPHGGDRASRNPRVSRCNYIEDIGCKAEARREATRAIVRQRICLLEGELSALQAKPDVSHGCANGWRGHGLTASTRNNDVLPAFCRPTKVTSISIALVVAGSAHGSKGRQTAGGRTRTRPAWGNRRLGAVQLRVPTHQNVRRSQSYTFRNSPAMLRSRIGYRLGAIEGRASTTGRTRVDGASDATKYAWPRGRRQRDFSIKRRERGAMH